MMKTVAVADCFRGNRECCGILMDRVREKVRDCRIIWIAGGEFEADGRRAVRTAAGDAELLADSGADLVLIPPRTALLDRTGTDIFARIALIGRLHCVDLIAVPVSGAHSGDEIKNLAMFLFREPADFQRDVRKAMAAGASMEEAKRSCAEHYVPGAAEMLSDPLDGPAVEFQKCMYQLYCCIRVEWIPMEGLGIENGSADEDDSLFGSHSADERIFAMMQDRKNGSGFAAEILETAGGTETVRQTAVMDLPAWKALAGEERAELRRFVLRHLAGIRMADNQMCGLHTYCPYAMLGSAAKEESSAWFSDVIGKSWTPLFTRDQMDRKAEEDPGMRIFRDIDAAVRRIYEETE